MVIWIIGLSGAGKSTLATKVVEHIRLADRKVILLDGDEVRELFQNDLAHDVASRNKNAERISRLCKFLDTQGIDVVCSILSISEKPRKWCRSNLSKYFEVYIKTPLNRLQERDSKGLYSKFERSEINNVAGLDIEFEEPKNANLVIQNDRSKEDLLNYADMLSSLILKNNL